jgi:hypothetical protein
MDMLPTRQYLVRSFYGAVHILSCRAMPPDRPIAEYIAIASLLGQLIRRLYGHIQSEVPTFNEMFVSSSLGLLIGISADSSKSRAKIGFSVSGLQRHRKILIRERRRNLPELSSVSGNVDWQSGNCAEAETFGYLKYLKRELSNSSAAGMRGIVFLSLTFRVLGSTRSELPLKEKQMCQLCHALTEILSRDLSCPILDLCPVT